MTATLGPSAAPPKIDAPFPIVGIGASAGGLEAIGQLLENLPTHTGMAFVVVQHLDPARESALALLLGRVTALPVSDVTDGVVVRPDRVYVIPPGRDLAIAQRTLRLVPRRHPAGARRAIDSFFESLAQDQGECAIGVILSGTATDGTLGLEAIRAAGGLTFAQDRSAKYDSMPASAVRAGCVDAVLPPKGIASELVRIARHPYAVPGRRESLAPRARPREPKGAQARGRPKATRPPPAPGARPRASASASAVLRSDDAPDDRGSAEGHERILHLLREHAGIDFTLYKSSTVTRRIHRRMVMKQVTTLERYERFLRGNTAELVALHADMLITLTTFFRNPETFDALKAVVFSKLAKRGRRDPIRIWVPGCSTGQEPYSLVMALLEATERVPDPPRLQVFATDVSHKAVEFARAGRYPTSMLVDVTPERIERFFEEEASDRFRVRKAIRERVVFAQHDLLSAPPFSRLDLVSCRNLLIYLRDESQRRVLSTFAYALNPSGFLFLGSSESPSSLTSAFETVDARHRIYSRIAGSPPAASRPSARERTATTRAVPAPARTGAPQGAQVDLGVVRTADRVALGRYAPRGVLVDSDLQVVEFRGDTRPWLKPPTGKATFDLRRIVHEGLLGPLQSALREAKRVEGVARKDLVRVEHEGRAHTVALEVLPLRHSGKDYFLVCIETASTHAKRIGRDAKAAGSRATKHDATEASTVPLGDGKSVRVLKRRIAELERELAEALDGIQSLEERHAAITEEMQSANEESTSGNEELQSLNEEMEAAKEELESANEELTTVNDEMASQNVLLARLNNDLLNTERVADLEIISAGRDGAVRRFTPSAAAHFALKESDVGRSLQSCIRLPALDRPIADVIADGTERKIDFPDAGGRWYSARLALTGARARTSRASSCPSWTSTRTRSATRSSSSRASTSRRSCEPCATPS